MSEEVTIYETEDIKITNLRAMFGDKTYSVANITSVEKKEIRANGCFPLALMGIGALMAYSAFRPEAGDGGFVNIALGAILFFAGLGIATKKPSFSVSLTTAGGEVKAFESPDESKIKAIVSALNDAIIKKGQ